MAIARRYLGMLVLAGCLPAVRLEAQSVIHLGGQTAVDSSYIHREVPAERMRSKRFTWKRRVVQNVVTRDNYYYHAQQKLDEVLLAVRRQHLEHYDSLLDFYPWSFREFQPYRDDLDSVVLKAGIGIQIHDPRGKWIPRLYLLVGEASFYERKDSQALRAFRYINRQYGPRDADGNELPIGTALQGGRSPSICSPETGKPPLYPSRNDALVWLTRCYMAQGNASEALPLLETLLRDPLLPERLRPELLGLKAYWYSETRQVTREIESLRQALVLPQPSYLRSRWYFLLGQLEDRSHQPQQAYEAFRHCAGTHPEPLMAFYARLRMAEDQIRLGHGDADSGSRALLAMARRSRYERYRGIVYYELGRLALQSGLRAEADSFFQISATENQADAAQKRRSFLALAQSCESQGAYARALSAYDSLGSLGGSGRQQQDWTAQRKLLEQLVSARGRYRLEDSLLALGALSPELLHRKLERMLKDSLRARRRASAAQPSVRNSGGTSLLTAAGSPSSGSGTWYFYNAAAKSRGFSEFQALWGDRPLQDNWRTSDQSSGLEATAVLPAAAQLSRAAPAASLSLTGLEAEIPIDSIQRTRARRQMAGALYEEGRLLQDELGHPRAAGALFQHFLQQFPLDTLRPKVLYRLELLSRQSGDSLRAEAYARELNSSYPKGAKTRMQAPSGPDENKSWQNLYDSCYFLYLSGSYDSVQVLVDSLRQSSDKGPDFSRFELLEATSLIKMGKDSLGSALLESLLRQPRAGSDPAIARQAGRLLEALSHKQQLIDHLLQLEGKVQAPAAASLPARPLAKGSLLPAPARVPDTLDRKPAAKDSLPAAPPAIEFSLKADEPFFVVLAYGRIDKQLMEHSLEDAVRYDRAAHPNVEVGSFVLQGRQALLIFRVFPDADSAMSFARDLQAQAAAGAFPSLKGTSYRILAISRDNFIQLNRREDWSGYLRFYEAHYR